MNEHEIGILRKRQEKLLKTGGDALGTAQIGVVIALIESLGNRRIDGRMDSLLEKIGGRVPHPGEDELAIALSNWLARAGATTDATRKVIQFGLYKD